MTLDFDALGINAQIDQHIGHCPLKRCAKVSPVLPSQSTKSCHQTIERAQHRSLDTDNAHTIARPIQQGHGPANTPGDAA